MSNKGPVNPGSSTLTEGLKRKRGRPKKQPQEGAVGPLPVKKPRGRPKGSKKVTTVSEKVPQPVAKGEASQEGNPQGSSDLNSNSAPATQGITGKDGSRPDKTPDRRRSLGSIPATDQ
ncbi:uncharacterized protein LOC133214417 isoform X2 [Neopsephotus bourkii]|uniref:uncharacterized protein LOC133214417 isoform X2 n=1 Tax=Neopsephotus bourkii TaxID=309878 RepID=UPI002AA5C2DD|nr:uncharacterized protein LOC133214417 isoform X2 [Neopsephotus bourkii]